MRLRIDITSRDFRVIRSSLADGRLTLQLCDRPCPIGISGGALIPREADSLELVLSADQVEQLASIVGQAAEQFTAANEEG
jgi:hypothetical protein